MSQYAWRIGSVAARALALVLSARVGWQAAYLACAVFALLSMLTGLALGEPARHYEVSHKRATAEYTQSITWQLHDIFMPTRAFLVLLLTSLHKIGEPQGK